MGTRAMVCTAPEVRGSGVRCEPEPLQPQSYRFKAASTSSGVCACRHRRRDRTRSSSLRSSACSVKKPNSRVIGEPEKLRAIAVEQAETLKTDECRALCSEVVRLPTRRSLDASRRRNHPAKLCAAQPAKTRRIRMNVGID